jgi:hydroxymethylpyrimidine pyrophosphatase-like HAD family hydrolase
MCLGSVRHRDLLAICLEGALLGPSGEVATEDVRTIAALRARGVAVVVVTARMPRAAVAYATAFASDVPIACGDGTVVCDARTGRILGREPLVAAAAGPALAVLEDARLAPIVLTERGVHGRSLAAVPLALGRAGSDGLVLSSDSARLRDAVALLAVGEEDAVRRAQGAAQSVPSIDAATYPVGANMWAIRLHRRGRNRARALASIAARLGIERRRCAYLGGRCEPYDDPSPFAWAGQSFTATGAQPVATAASVMGLDPGDGAVRALSRVWP